MRCEGFKGEILLLQTTWLFIEMSFNRMVLQKKEPSFLQTPSSHDCWFFLIPKCSVFDLGFSLVQRTSAKGMKRQAASPARMDGGRMSGGRMARAIQPQQSHVAVLDGLFGSLMSCRKYLCTLWRFSQLNIATLWAKWDNKSRSESTSPEHYNPVTSSRF